MKKLLSIASIVFLMMVLAACGSNNSKNEGAENNNNNSADNEPKTEEVEEVEELTIKHQLGETPVKVNPEKVVVFDFGSLDTLDKLGIEVTALPQNNIPSYLEKYEDEKYVNVGSLKEPDLEKINEIKPDLIIISGRQSDLYEEFSKIAPTIFLGVDTARYMESFEENVKTIGQIFDKEAEAEAELAKIEDDIKALNDKASALDEKALIVLANEGKVSAYGPSSRFGIIHDVFGFAPVDSTIEVSTHGQSISFEYILEKDPDVLFVIDRSAAVGGEAGAKESIENDLVKGTKAYKNGKIIYLDPDFWYLSGGGLESVAQMVNEVGASVE
ncbi:siderophore ABC transporter substrate-binding protein [Bacillus sp. FJAT-50079]|uniref:siderophore ABC transporter substrate-binding protein n=1 Tax=Bacillus sp. FJAT-50079 TaxID=2833577 RepID=UPI001BC93844|nr:siderophore ABC transporter substrate-binding protein [Bacillus sp. FJAT-50079]MBS4209557.1 siderophore ABC transporter substrate-binding protein [Bacillus sp. FJAT-50079]